MRNRRITKWTLAADAAILGAIYAIGFAFVWVAWAWVQAASN